jgi:hypothetical protein
MLQQELSQIFLVRGNDDIRVFKKCAINSTFEDHVLWIVGWGCLERQ